MNGSTVARAEPTAAVAGPVVASIGRTDARRGPAVDPIVPAFTRREAMAGADRGPRSGRFAWPLAAVLGFGAAALTGAAGAATTVYRCGDTYSQQPCPAASRALVIDDARSEAQRAAAAQDAARERRLGDAMERDRLARERATRPRGAGRLDRDVAAAAKPPASKASEPARRRRSAKLRASAALTSDDFVAIDPTTVGSRSKTTSSSR